MAIPKLILVYTPGPLVGAIQLAGAFSIKLELIRIAMNS